MCILSYDHESNLKWRNLKMKKILLASIVLGLFAATNPVFASGNSPLSFVSTDQQPLTRGGEQVVEEKFFPIFNAHVVIERKSQYYPLVQEFGEKLRTYIQDLPVDERFTQGDKDYFEEYINHNLKFKTSSTFLWRAMVSLQAAQSQSMRQDEKDLLLYSAGEMSSFLTESLIGTTEAGRPTWTYFDYSFFEKEKNGSSELSSSNPYALTKFERRNTTEEFDRMTTLQPYQTEINNLLFRSISEIVYPILGGGVLDIPFMIENLIKFRHLVAFPNTENPEINVHGISNFSPFGVTVHDIGGHVLFNKRRDSIRDYAADLVYRAHKKGLIIKSDFINFVVEHVKEKHDLITETLESILNEIDSMHSAGSILKGTYRKYLYGFFEILHEDGRFFDGSFRASTLTELFPTSDIYNIERQEEANDALEYPWEAGSDEEILQKVISMEQRVDSLYYPSGFTRENVSSYTIHRLDNLFLVELILDKGQAVHTQLTKFQYGYNRALDEVSGLKYAHMIGGQDYSRTTSKKIAQVQVDSIGAKRQEVKNIFCEFARSVNPETYQEKFSRIDSNFEENLKAYEENLKAYYH